MKSPPVSVIIVTYNSKDYISQCLDSVLAISYKPVEIIIVDNNSTDVTRTILSKYKARVKLILSEKNLGYAEGKNLGINSSIGEYIFLLNPDTLVEKDFLEPLVYAMETDKQIAVCQPAVYLLQDPTKLNLTGKRTHFLGFDWIKDYNSSSLPPSGNITSFSGCGVLLKRKILKRTGLFDPEYFMYYEDSDLSWRLKLFGYKIEFVPTSKMYHDYKYIPVENYQPLKKKLFYNERNRLLTIFKNYSINTLLLILPSMIFMEIGLVLLSFSEGWVSEKLRSYFSIWQLLPHIQKERNSIQKMRVVSDKDIVRDYENEITFEKFNNIVMKILVNPVLSFYWYLVRRYI